MSALRVARLAQQRRSPREHCRLDRTVRRVTQQTILADGRVFEQIGTTQLGMAAPAQFIDGVALEQGIARGMMRAVTGSAGHNALADGMGIGLEVVGPLLCVTFVAYIRLFGQHRDGIYFCMQVVAVGAGDLTGLVGTAGPLQSDIPGMALHAHGVLFLYRRGGITAEVDNRRMTCTHILPPCMGAARSVAAFALKIGEGCIRVSTLSVRSSEDVLHALAIVATQAGICPFLTVIGSECCRLLSCFPHSGGSGLCNVPRPHQGRADPDNQDDTDLSCGFQVLHGVTSLPAYQCAGGRPGISVHSRTAHRFCGIS